MKDVMLDIETLGTRCSSAIIQIGACYFDRTTGEVGECFKMNIHSEYDDRFTYDWRTVSRWLLQSQEARESVATAGTKLDASLERLTRFLKDAECIWSHATFDMPILTHAYEVCGMEFPIPYRGMRDIRTLTDIADHRGTKEREGVHHDALDDCIFQVGYCVEALNKINV